MSKFTKDLSIEHSSISYKRKLRRREVSLKLPSSNVGTIMNEEKAKEH